MHAQEMISVSTQTGEVGGIVGELLTPKQKEALVTMVKQLAEKRHEEMKAQNEAEFEKRVADDIFQGRIDVFALLCSHNTELTYDDAWRRAEEITVFAKDKIKERNLRAQAPITVVQGTLTN